VEVPARLTDEVAVHAWSAGRAARLVAAAMVSPSMYVTVLGDGAVAFLAAQLLTGRCEHVRLVSSEAWLIEECQRLGIRSRLGDEVGRRHDQHVVLDTTGRYADLASRMVRPKGVVVMGSSGAESQVLDVMEITSRDVTLTGCVGGSIAEGVGLLARGRVDVNGLLSATHDWSAGNLAGLSGAGILLRFSTFPSHAKAG
jgi:threonine dehydrogenase-like Zn-dependent dehydrogenase